MEILRLGGDGPAYRKGLLSSSASKARSVVFTEAGLREAETAIHRLFESDD